MDTAGRQGSGTGNGSGERRRRLRLVALEEGTGGRGREGDEGGECEAVRAIQTALAGLSAAPRKLAGRRWHGRVCAHGEHALGVLLARWRRRLASASWVGPHSVGLSGGLCQVSGQVLLSLSFLI